MSLLLAGCGYSFVLKGGGDLGPVSLSPSRNQTALREASMTLDAQLERELAVMGLHRDGPDLPLLFCTITKARSRTITSSSPTRDDRYRLSLTVQAELKDSGGKSIWQAVFSDDGTYAQGGQEEDALDEACRDIAGRIARQLASLNR